MFSFASAGAACPRFQGGIQINMRSLPCWNKTENNASRERKQNGKTQNYAIHLNRTRVWNILWHCRNECFRPPLCDEQTKQPANSGQKHALD